MTPGMMATGMNTAISTAVVAMMGPVTSLHRLARGGERLRPASIWRSTFSTTTMASSTTRPIASTMPRRESMLSEKPKSSITPACRSATQEWRWPG